MILTRHPLSRFAPGLVTSLIFLLSFQTVTAGTFAEGVLAYNNREYSRALDTWLPLAEQGHVLAQTLVGSLYAYGEGIKRNDAEAAKWFERAAQAGSAQAQYNLAIMYENGWGVDKDVAQAKHWYRQAADQGRKDAASRYALIGDIASETSSVTQHPRTQHQENPSGTTALMPYIPINQPDNDQTQQPDNKAAAGSDDIDTTTWVGEQPARHYTLQLVASSNSQVLRDNIARLGLPGDHYAVIKSRHNNSKWYALIYGSYPTVGEARRAIRNLPDSARHYEPWIRSFADIKSRDEQTGLVDTPGN